MIHDDTCMHSFSAGKASNLGYATTTYPTAVEAATSARCCDALSLDRCRAGREGMTVVFSDGEPTSISTEVYIPHTSLVNLSYCVVVVVVVSLFLLTSQLMCED